MNDCTHQNQDLKKCDSETSLFESFVIFSSLFHVSRGFFRYKHKADKEISGHYIDYLPLKTNNCWWRGREGDQKEACGEYHLRIATGDGSLATVLPKLHNRTVALLLLGK